MYKIIKDKIEALPANTHLFYGHEYAVVNLEFAITIDDQNEVI
jgi:hypothetical protein